MDRYYTISSGSHGNCSLYSYKDTHILIDLGVSLAQLISALENISLSIKDITCVFISHEHIDHIRGVEKLCKNYDIPIYMPKNSMEKMGFLKVIPFEIGEEFSINLVKVKTFELSHDSLECSGFKISTNLHSFGYATDFGCITNTIKNALKGCNTVVLEANHDLKMLSNGSYPSYLKNRITSNKGHLSNTDCAKLACYLAENDTKKIILAHISSSNNTPEHAFVSVRQMLEDNNLFCDITVAPTSFIKRETKCCI